MPDNKKNKAPAAPPREWTEELQAAYDSILSVGEECISADELKKLLLAKSFAPGDESTPPTAGFNLYDGFEPSGRMHIAQGVFKAMNVNKCTAAPGATFVFWVADWFALMNDKMGGDLEKIRIVGMYLQQVWKAAGMNLENVEFKWASTEITQQAAIYWPLMLDVARRFNITRIKKCCQIMGRLEGSLTAAQVLYPLMQCTDVFFLKADICQLGVDQRKVNMLAREYCDAAKRKFKPVILSHHMLYGLKAGQEKMSKSDPDSAIFMEDTPDDVERKVLNAYCPSVEQQPAASSNKEEQDAGKESMHLTVDTLKNPCLDYVQHIIFSPPGATFTAGGTTFNEFGTVKKAFISGELSEESLKRGLIDALNKLLQPVRDHFTNDDTAKSLLEQVRQFKKDSSKPVEGSSGALPAALRRLDLSATIAPNETNLVFLPLPSTTPTLQSAMNVLSQIKAANATSSAATTVLFCSDWSARVSNANGADEKAIAAYYTVLITALNALDASTMASVKVIYQSEAILTDPSNYWISVINVGRHFMLDRVMGIHGEDSLLTDSDGVGHVIARLMKVADIASVQPAVVSLDSDAAGTLEQELVTEFITQKLAGMAPQFANASETSLRLQPVRESAALATENDEYLVTDDPAVNVKSKLKKAFCEPGNVDFCPPIALAQVFAFSASSFTISRSAENGGDQTYESVDALKADFGSEAIHPGDLKAAVTALTMQVFSNVSKAIKASKEAVQATKTLKACQKKLSKLKK